MPGSSGTIVASDGPSSAARNVARRQLFELLDSAGRVTVVSAPAGSGKTVLLRSWIAAAGLLDRTAWVSVAREGRDPLRFWLSVVDALRGTRPGSGAVRELTAAPTLDVEAVIERLLEDLEVLEDRVWLVIDDAHELLVEETLRQLQLLVMRAPVALRLVLSARHDLPLGLHRLRVEGQMSEIRAEDLRFTPAEARALFDVAGVKLSDVALSQLVARTEGWAAGLRLAALSLAEHPDPEQFSAEFSGSERTVAEYLLAEVLQRQPPEIRRFLLRTSVLERVNGPLADLLTGGSGGQRVLDQLEAGNAFVVSLDAQRSWFRYHRLFADLLERELRRTLPAELPTLHRTAAEWFADSGYPLEAVRHAQEAKEWRLSTRLLSDNWFSLYLNGQAVTLHELLAGFPAGAVAEDAELATVMAADELIQGSLQGAERYLALATREFDSVPLERRTQWQVLLTIQRLFLARQQGDLPAVAEGAAQLLAAAEDPDAARFGLGADSQAVALVSLGIAELWSLRIEEAEAHLQRCVSLARRIGRPWLEINALAHLAIVASYQSFDQTVDLCTQAIGLAAHHGWEEDRVGGFAYLALAGATLARGRLDEAEGHLQRAERTLRAELEPAAGLVLHQARGMFEIASGRNAQALAAFEAAQRLAEVVVTPHGLTTQSRAFVLEALTRLGETQRVVQALAELDEAERETAEMRKTLAGLRLVQGDPQAATRALAPILSGAVPIAHPSWLAEALLCEATARDALGDAVATGRALEQALEIAAANGTVYAFLLHPLPDLLERHRGCGTAHLALISEILTLLAGQDRTSAPERADPLLEPLSQSETRILRYLPTNLSAPEIATELYLSTNTVKTHMRHLYAKLGAHRRSEAVERARLLGLLRSSSRTDGTRTGD